LYQKVDPIVPVHSRERNAYVMGAYGHWRIKEFVIGGTTRELLEKATIPVIMSR
jgi:nucleotide-binding universal stress UspA family protein